MKLKETVSGYFWSAPFWFSLKCDTKYRNLIVKNIYVLVSNFNFRRCMASMLKNCYYKSKHFYSYNCCQIFNKEIG